jgi:xanthine dehydrogenase small subunit
MRQQWERFASVPIRNSGTLGGNVANGSPIGDSMPWLIVLEASVRLRNVDGQRILPLERLYLDYMQQDRKDDEIIEAIIVPKPQPGQLFRTYKLSRRYDSDISAVCAAFRIILDRETIMDIRIAFGGMAATPKRATHTEQLLHGKTWSEMLVKDAMNTLDEDFSPLSDMRASAQNRAQSAKNLLYRFFLETRPNNPVAAEHISVFSQTN